MLNQVVLVGRITKEIEKKGENESIVTIAVQRSTKNTEGIYETDYIEITLLNLIAEHTTEYCKQGDIIGVKGRIQATEGNIKVIADKVTFLSSKKED